MYIYLETSWEKESWCKALYLASSEDEEKLKWVNKLNTEFHSYLISLNAVYPSFMKPYSHISTEPIDKSNKLDGSSSKVRNFLRKLSKKSSKSSIENKANLSSREAPTEKSIDCSTEEIIVPSSLATLNASASRNHIPVISDVDSDDRASDEGTLCWNLLISRLFFDAKQNEEMRTSLQARIQRTLSNMRTPTYIGEVICTTVDLGNLPPYIHAMKVLPSDMTEIWMMEIEIEYSGGALFEIETRLEVQDLELQEGGPGIEESSSLDEVKADMLEGIEQFRENLKYSEETSDSCDHRDEGDVKGDAIKHSRNVTGAVPQQSRWKSIIHSIAKQVSQVPLTLGMRVASLRGIMRVFIKPPPSDQIWFGFTSMPDLDFQFEPFVGEHRIASGHIALFLISRLKVAIRETLVIPNCESVCLSWMLAEKEDWIPRKFAPFLWTNQEAPNTENWEVKRSDEANKEIGSSYSESCEGQKKVELSLKKPNDSSNTRSPSPSPSPVVDKPTVKYSSSMKELQVPLLHSEEQAEVNQRKSTDSAEFYTKSRQVELAEEQSRISEEDDGKPRRQGTRAKMISLSKKMSEKFEEKKRNIEEKGRNIVERMKGQQ
nr:uncharacterized protein LOC109167016 [Ipomoea trifida]